MPVALKRFAADVQSPDIPGTSRARPTSRRGIASTRRKTVPRGHGRQTAATTNIPSAQPTNRRGRWQQTTRGRVRGGPGTDYSWSKTFIPRNNAPFTGIRGLKRNFSQTEHSALSCFKLFMTDSNIQYMVDMTYLNARRKLQKKAEEHARIIPSTSSDNPSRSWSWQAITIPEFLTWLGLVIVMGILRLPNRRMYWQTNNYITELKMLPSIM